jgi:cellobiose transport system permease protein
MSSITRVAVPQGKAVERHPAVHTSKIGKYLPLYLSIAPYYILFLAFGIAPIIFSAYLAFQKWDGIGQMTFVGFGNFSYLFTSNIFGQAIVNTFEIWFMSTIPMLLLGLILAFLINMRQRSKFLFQVCYYLPYVTSIVAITLIFGSLFGSQYGLIDEVLTGLHLPAVQWLTGAWPIKWALALIVIWRWTGYNALIYMAGLQSIPTEFYEVARIDGANTWNIFLHITIPLLRPVILFTVVTSTFGGLTLFTEPQVLLGNSGGPGSAGLTMSLYQYAQGFGSDHFGLGAAIGWAIFFITLAFTIINWRVVQRGEQ